MDLKERSNRDLLRELGIPQEHIIYSRLEKLLSSLAKKDKTPDFSRGFNAGRNATLRRNPSGCCCKFTDEKEGEDIVSLCEAHREYIDNKLAEKEKEGK